MEAVLEEPEFGASHQNCADQQTDVEKKAVECFKALLEAEKTERKALDAGIEFGKAILELHDEIAASGTRDWMDRLKQLDISYETARYWMAKVKGEPTDRHKKPQDKPGFDWEAALARLEKLRDDVIIHKPRQPEGSDILFDPLADLAGALGWEITKGGA